MTDKKRPPIAQFIENVIAEGDVGKILTESARTAELFAQEATRLRAWECLLFVFFTRYYLEKENPISLANSDRDFLTTRIRSDDKHEHVAEQIEVLFGKIVELIQNYQSSGSESLDLTSDYDN